MRDNGSGGYTMDLMEPWLAANYGNARIDFTDLGREDGNLYAAINMNAWRLAGSPPSLPPGTPVDFVNGRSPMLPGYTVGTAQVSFNAASGWVVPGPLNGRAFSIGDIGFTSGIPEPGTLGLLFLGGVTVLRRRMRHDIA